MTGAMKRAHVYISGKVQGVWFREAARQQAQRLALQGWVRNLVDGRVEAVFEGAEGRVAEMVQWCHVGPGAAQVEAVDVLESDATGEFSAFRVTG
jgi:acylphosphatase